MWDQAVSDGARALACKNTEPGLRVLIWESSGAKVIKTGPTCKYFCTRLDGGLITENTEGSLAKSSALTVTLGI